MKIEDAVREAEQQFLEDARMKNGVAGGDIVSFKLRNAKTDSKKTSSDVVGIFYAMSGNMIFLHYVMINGQPFKNYATFMLESPDQLYFASERDKQFLKIMIENKTNEFK